MGYGPCDGCGKEKSDANKWYLDDGKTRCWDCFWLPIIKGVEEETKMETKEEPKYLEGKKAGAALANSTPACFCQGIIEGIGETMNDDPE